MAEAAGDIAGPINAETGDTSQWTSIVTTGGMTFDANAAGALHGSYGFRSIGNGIGGSAYGIKTFTDKTVLYARGYINISSLISVAQYSLAYPLAIFDGSTQLVGIGAQRTAAGSGAYNQWRIVGQDLTSTSSGTNFSLDAPHYIDIYWYAGTGANGGATIWVDGSQILSELNNDLTAYAADSIRGGSYNSTLSDGHAIYTDDFLVSTSGPIGVYTEASAGSIIPLFMNQYRRRLG